LAEVENALGGLNIGEASLVLRVSDRASCNSCITMCIGEETALQSSEVCMRKPLGKIGGKCVLTSNYFKVEFRCASLLSCLHYTIFLLIFSHAHIKHFCLSSRPVRRPKCVYRYLVRETTHVPDSILTRSTSGASYSQYI
jgi:hypothetical protein